jgi:hypothetical protein
MNHHPIRFAVLAIALLALGSSLSAQDRGPDFGPGHGPAQAGPHSSPVLDPRISGALP